MGKDYSKAIAASGLSIYDPIEIGDPALWVPTPELQSLLDARLRGISLAGLALRTRSKVVKEHVCRALGYPRVSSASRIATGSGNKPLSSPASSPRGMLVLSG